MAWTDSYACTRSGPLLYRRFWPSFRSPRTDIVRLNKTSASGQENLTTLANATGGDVFVSDETRHLESIFSKITAELRAQYLMLYYSLIPDMDGKFHTIKVSVPDQPGLNIRTRAGFLAVNSSTE